MHDGITSSCIASDCSARKRVFRNADHSGADRTSDRAGAAPESAAHLKPVRHRTVSRVVSVTRRWHGRDLPCAPSLGRGISIGTGPSSASFSIGITTAARSDRANAAALSPKAHIGEREIANQNIIFRLFVEERFKFVARLSPTFLSSSMIAATSCAQPNQKRSSPLM